MLKTGQIDLHRKVKILLQLDTLRFNSLIMEFFKHGRLRNTGKNLRQELEKKISRNLGTKSCSCQEQISYSDGESLLSIFFSQGEYGKNDSEFSNDYSWLKNGLNPRENTHQE